MSDELVELTIKRPDGGLVLKQLIAKSQRTIIGEVVIRDGVLVLDVVFYTELAPFNDQVASIIQPQFPIIGDLNFSVKPKK